MVKSSAVKWVGLVVLGLVFAGWVGFRQLDAWRVQVCQSVAEEEGSCPLCGIGGGKSARTMTVSAAVDQPATKGDSNSPGAENGANAAIKEGDMKSEQAIFAAGCFWGVQMTFDHVPGVTATEVGYSNGKTKDPTYKQVCTHTTGHAEVVRVTFDPTKVSFGQLVDVFFGSHNPTQVNRQGPDYGDQYRSAIFYLSDAQKASADERKKAWQAKFSKPIATEITPAAEFYTAEDYHQKYLEKKGQTECHLPSYERGDLAPGKDSKWAPPPAAGPSSTKSVESPGGKIQKSDAEWKKTLTPEQYEVLRMKGTERPFTGKYWQTKTPGTYVCAGCGAELFTSDAKFDSGCGWPSFDKAVAEGKIEERVDNSHGMVRTEVVCARCGGHLGHLFDDGPTKTGMRYCINSVSIDLKPKDQAQSSDQTKGEK